MGTFANGKTRGSGLLEGLGDDVANATAAEEEKKAVGVAPNGVRVIVGAIVEPIVCSVNDGVIVSISGACKRNYFEL